MRNRRTLIIRTNLALAVSIGAWTVVACSSGTGPYTPLDDPYDPAPVSREAPPNSRDTPPNSNEAPPLSGDNPGTFGGGPSSRGNCPPCDQTFRCTESANGGKPSTDTVQLKTINGVCTSPDSQGQPPTVIACDGTIQSNGTAVGTWHADGSGGFTATATETVTITNGTAKTTTQVTVTLSCTPKSATPTPTMTATPVPTPTMTVKPPVFDAGIVDSGTKG
jgi:hypothetical protein